MLLLLLLLLLLQPAGVPQLSSNSVQYFGIIFHTWLQLTLWMTHTHTHTAAPAACTTRAAVSLSSSPRGGTVSFLVEDYGSFSTFATGLRVSHATP